MIFICHFDPFGAKKCCYTFEERCVEDLSVSLGDETQKIFLNTLGENRDEVSPILAEFLDYLKNPTTMKLKNKKIVELDNRVNQIKIDAKVRSRYMTLKEWLDDMVEQEVDFIREKIKEQVEEEVREQVEEEVRERVKEEVREQVKEEVRERVKEEVREQVEEEMRQELRIEGEIQLLRKFYIKAINEQITKVAQKAAIFVCCTKIFLALITQMFLA